MEKDLKHELKSFLKNFNAESINNYFACDFSDDWDTYYIHNKYSNIEDILQYLNDIFIDIDLQYRDTDMFENMVRNALENAINMLEDATK